MWQSSFLYLFIGLSVPALIILFFRNKEIIRRKGLVSFINFTFIYIVIIGSAWAYDSYLNFMLESFDLDKDGIFSIEEQTADQKRYMELVSNDLGRNLIPYIGLLFAVVHSVVFFLVLLAIRLIRKQAEGRLASK